jgi:hypothetical protein
LLIPTILALAVTQALSTEVLATLLGGVLQAIFSGVARAVAPVVRVITKSDDTFLF